MKTIVAGFTRGSQMDSENRPEPAGATGPRPFSEKLYTLWVALVLVAVIAAGFGISFFAYPYLVTNGPSASVETMGELWDGSPP
jgi:hypothetical protein